MTVQIETIEAIVERSSLGTPGARSLRLRTPGDEARAVAHAAVIGLASVDYRQPAPPLEGEADSRILIDRLVAAAVSGDMRARDELLALIHPLVLKYCRARLGRQESLMGSADDVAQDVCMAIVCALPNYQLKGLSFRAFVYGVAAHKVTDAFRAIGRSRSEPMGSAADDVPSVGDGPEQHLLAAEMSARLGKLLGYLTPRQREVLVLRLAAGLSAEETAVAVHSTPGAVRVTQHRALGRLRKILLGESGARGLASPEPLQEAEGAPAASADDLILEEFDLDPDVAAADDAAIDAIAAFFGGADSEPVVPIPAPHRPALLPRVTPVWKQR